MFQFAFAAARLIDSEASMIYHILLCSPAPYTIYISCCAHFPCLQSWAVRTVSGLLCWPCTPCLRLLRSGS